MAKSKLLSIFIILSLLVLPLAYAIDTFSDGNNIGPISTYLSTFSKFIGAALVPMTIFPGDSTDYDCNEEYKSGAVVADNSGVVKLSNQAPLTEWIRISIVDSFGNIKDNGFWKKGTDYINTFIAGRTYTYHIFKCVPKGASTGGGITQPICTQEAGSLCNPISGGVASYFNGCVKSDLQKQGYISSDLSLCSTNGQLLSPCIKLGGFFKGSSSCSSGYVEMSYQGTSCCFFIGIKECLDNDGEIASQCLTSKAEYKTTNTFPINLKCCKPQQSPSQVCVSVCVPLYELNKNCALNSCGSGCGADNINTFNTESGCKAKLTLTPTQPTKPKYGMRMTNLKIINNLDAISGGIDEFLYGFGNAGEIFAVTIQNTGTEAIAPTIEAYFVSKDNPFARNREQNLCNIPLQSFLGVAGIDKLSLKTCKGEAGDTYKLSTLLPNELPKTFYIYVPYPRGAASTGTVDQQLAGYPNYNKDGLYFLDVVLVDDCTNVNVLDEVGGTLGYAVSGGTRQCNNIISDYGTQQSGNQGGNSVPQSDADKTAIQPSARQITIARDKIAQTTATDLTKSACKESVMCVDDATCQSLQSLVEEEYISEQKAKSDVKEIKNRLRVILDTAGATAGAVGGGLIGAKGGLAVCAAFGANTLGIGFPVCLGVLTLGGAVIGGTFSDTVFKLFDGYEKEDLKEIGYCVPKDDSSKKSGIVDSIGKSINEAFGGKKKTNIDNFALGAFALGILAFLVIFKK